MFFFFRWPESKSRDPIGIILSGTASDGSLGLKAIKSAGGLTYVQDSSAEFQSMPKSAVAENAVDAVMSPKELAFELVRLSKLKSLLESIYKSDPGENESDDNEAEQVQSDTEILQKEDISAVLKLLKKSTGVDFTNYKKNTISRRIARRLILNKFDQLEQYIEYLEKTPGEIDLLYQDILINVTRFFRYTEATAYLKTEVLPAIIKNKSTANPLRIWVPACSTGEEAYSTAMMVMDLQSESTRNVRMQIFGTDLSEAAILKARKGMYTEAEISELPQEYFRFFTKTDGHYRIIKRARDICIFAHHNVLKDPPFSKVDIVSCSNLLIYLNPSLQKKVLANFHYALNQHGYLILGKAETIGSSTDLFAPLNKKVKIYLKKTNTAARAAFDTNNNIPAVERVHFNSIKKQAIKEINSDESLQSAVDDILLSQYTPAAVVINHHLDIVQFRGSTGLFLEPSSGKASLNLLKMARTGLQIELRNAVQTVIKTEEPIKKTNLTVQHQGALYHVIFEVSPLPVQANEKLLLIVFEEVKTPSSSDLKITFSKDKRVKQLEAELKAIHEDMRSIAEEQGAANEELQSANEEIVSNNEELQSINEELETSKEELASSNEELMTINQELQVKNEQLTEAHEYTEALIGTIREASIVLDSGLRVRSANKSFYRTFLAKEEETEGKIFYEINNRQWDMPELKELIENVIP